MRNDTRGAWAASMGIPTLAEDPEVDVLYWVGCMASFDDRNKKVATALAKVLKAADVKFGILAQEENCTGDPARRIGNEYLWQMLAQQNIETLNGYGFNTKPEARSTGYRRQQRPCCRPRRKCEQWQQPASSALSLRLVRIASTPSRTSIRSLEATSR